MTITIERTNTDISESFRGDDKIDVGGLFGGQRAATYGAAVHGPEKWEGLVLEAERFMTAITSGRLPFYRFTEAMSTSNFPLLLADTLDRKLLGWYTASEPVWRNYVATETVNDFREVKRHTTTGIRGPLRKVKQGTPAAERGQDEAVYKYAVERYEGGFGVTFEEAVNDDLDALRNLPQDLARSAIDSEELFATQLWVGATGLNPVFFTGANDNVLANNPPLTRQALQDAITKLLERQDERGNPIEVTAVELNVGPGLLLAAQQIVDAIEYVARDAAGNETHIKGNGVSANLRINKCAWLPKVAGSNARTTWAVFANPQTSGRPALVMGHLRGYETPALYEKMPDMRRMGGGEVPWSYDQGEQRKKVAHVYGGTQIDGRMCVGSNGTNAP